MDNLTVSTSFNNFIKFKDLTFAVQDRYVQAK